MFLYRFITKDMTKGVRRSARRRDTEGKEWSGGFQAPLGALPSRHTMWSTIWSSFGLCAFSFLWGLAYFGMIGYDIDLYRSTQPSASPLRWKSDSEAGNFNSLITRWFPLATGPHSEAAQEPQESLHWKERYSYYPGDSKEFRSSTSHVIPQEMTKVLGAVR